MAARESSSQWRDWNIQSLKACHDGQSPQGLVSLIHSYQRALEQNGQLRTSIRVIECESDEMKEANQLLKEKLRNAEVWGNPELKDQYKDLEKKYISCQEELTTLYKNRGQNAQQLLDFSDQLKQKNEALEAKDAALNNLQIELDNLKQNYNVIETNLNEKALTVQVLQDELQAIQLELVKTTEKCEDLKRENEGLLERWLRKMNEEAQKMNKANEFYESVVEKQKHAGLKEAAEMRTAEQLQANNAGETLFVRDRLGSIDGGRPEVPCRLGRLWEAHEDVINDCVFNTAGNSLASGGSDKRVKLWDCRSVLSGGSLGKVHASGILEGSNEGITKLHFNSKDEFVLAASTDMSTRLWHVGSGRLRHTLSGHMNKVVTAMFSDDCSKVISGSHDRTIKVWDLVKGYCTRTMFCGSSINDLVLSDASGSGVISGHLDGQIRFWDARAADCTNQLNGIHTGQVTSVLLTPDRSNLITMARDNTLKLIDLRMFDVLKTFCDTSFSIPTNFSRCSLSVDGSHVAAGTSSGEVFIWPVTEPQGTSPTVLKYQSSDGKKTSPIFSVSWNNMNQLACCHKDKSLSIWV
eukprot:Nk52_evm1s1803 gene=Nk52_evmTU1s1803